MHKATGNDEAILVLTATQPVEIWGKTQGAFFFIELHPLFILFFSTLLHLFFGISCLGAAA